MRFENENFSVCVAMPIQINFISTDFGARFQQFNDIQKIFKKYSKIAESLFFILV